MFDPDAARRHDPARSLQSLDACRRNRRRKNPRPEVELEEDVPISLVPLPAFKHLPAAELRAVHEGLVAKIEADHAGRGFAERLLPGFGGVACAERLLPVLGKAPDSKP